MFLNIQLQSPIFFALLLLIPIIWYLSRRYLAFRQKTMRAFGEQMGPSEIASSRFWLFLVGMAFLGVAAVNPRVQGKPIMVSQKGGDVVFALDVSKSMLAEDVRPNRLERGKLVCLSLLQGFDNQRVAVVVFAGDAFVLMPFSTNYQAVADFISEANPGQVSAQGSDFVNLAATLKEYFGKGEFAQRGIVVLSDGEDHSELKASDVQEMNKDGLVFFTVGLGTKKGAPIPDGRGYLQDVSGKKVVSKLEPKSLKTLAGKHGKYFSPSQTRALLSSIRHLKESHFSDMKSYEYNSLFQYLLFPGMLLILWSLFAGRKKSIAIFLIVWIIPSLASAQNENHKRLLKADKAYKTQHFDEATKLYKEVVDDDFYNEKAVYNLGVAQAKAGNQKEALKTFAEAVEMSDNQEDKANSLYNQGTLELAQKDKLAQSIEHLKEALANNPNDMDIRKNLAKAIQLKRKQDQQKQDQQKQDQQKQDQQKQDQQKQDQQKQDQQKQDQQKQDQQKQDQQKQDQHKQDQQKQDQQKQDSQQEEQGNKGEQNKDDKQQSNKKPVNIRKQKALQKLKAVEEAEKKVRRRMQKIKGLNNKNAKKEW